MRALIRLIGLYRPYAGWIVLAILVSLAATLANIGLMAVSGWFITAMAIAGAASQSMNYFTPAAIIRALAILRTGGRYVERVIGHEATFRLLTGLRGWLFARLEPLAPAALHDLRSGDLAARLKSDVDRLELVFLRLFAPLAVAVASAIVVIGVLARLNISLAAVVSVALLTAGLMLPAFTSWAGRRPGRRITGISTEIRARLVDDLEGLAPLQLTRADRSHFDALEQQFADLIGEEGRLARLTGLGQAGVGLAGDLAAGAALAVGVPLVASGRLAGPDLTMVTLLSLSAFEAFAGIPAAFAGLAATLESARCIFAIADREPVVTEPDQPQEAPARFDLTLVNVGLTYPQAHRSALANVDLDIPEGARIAVVGPSGAGKSSLVTLLIRFRDPNVGEIRLGGVPIRALAQQQLRARIAVVPQAPHLFTATIAENLRLARPHATKAELREAIASVGLGPLIDALPLGLDTPVGVAGTQLSGGEARRVAIARALLADAPILVLDEPGEGLDVDSEQRLFDALLPHKRDRTVVLLTHRLAALERMDEIVVLDAGRIIERGAFSDLLAKGTSFRRLFDQFDEAAVPRECQCIC